MVEKPRSGIDPARVDPARITDRVAFAVALTELREAAGLTVRDLARRAGLPTATVGGYLTGRHLPNPNQPEVLLAVLGVCGVTGEQARSWLEALRRVRRAPGPRPATPRSPYPGLASFQPEDAPFYFGRAALIGEIEARLTAVRDGTVAERIVVVTGVSGCGKSSVLRAGVVPRSAALRVRPAVMTPGDDPAAALQTALASVSTAGDGDKDRPILLVVDQAEEIFTAVDETRRAAFLQRLAELSRPAPAGAAAIVVLCLRADFYAAAAEEPVLLPALRTAQIVVGAMTTAELTEAITAPAAAAGVHVDEALVRTLLDDIAPRDRPGSALDRGALPLLAHALHATWAVSRRGRMTVEDYVATGGITGAVERTAESVWQGLTEAQRTSSRRIFLRLVFVDDGSMVTRRRARLEELQGLESAADHAEGRGRASDPPAADHAGGRPGRGGHVDDVITRFAQARLVTLRTDTVEISHEALIAAWRRLRRWVDADRSALRTHRELADSARVWQRAGRDDSYLLRGGRLGVVTELTTSGRLSLNDTERAFVAASNRQVAERRAQRRAQRMRLRIALVAVAVLALVASGVSVVALHAESAADQRAAEATAARDGAQSRELAIEADRLRAANPSLAAQLSLTAYRLSPTVDARSALLDSTALPLPTRITAQEGPTFLAVDRASSLVAITQAVSGGIDLWSLARSGVPQRLASLTSAEPGVQQFSVAISPDGRQLVAGDAQGLVERWNITDPRHPRRLPGPGVVFPSGVLTLVFSPDGSRLAAGGEGGRVQRWAVPDDGAATALPPIPAPALVSALAVSPDGRMLWVGDGDGTVTGHALGDDGMGLQRGSRPVVLSTGPSSVSALAVSPDGALLIAGTKRGEVHVWRHGSDSWAEQPQPLTPLAGWVDAIAFAPDGAGIAIGATGNDIRVLHRATMSQRAAMMAPGPVTALDFTGDGSLAAGSSDGYTRLWPMPGVVVGPVGDKVFDVAVPRPGHLDVGAAQGAGGLISYDVTDRTAPAGVTAPLPTGAGDVRLAGVLAASPDGSLAAMGAAGGQVQLWDTADPGHPRAVGVPFAAAADFVDGLAFSDDGSLLAVGSDASVVDLWNVADPAHPARLAETEQAGGLALSVAFQHGGTLLAGATSAGTVIVWDIADPAHPRRIATLSGLTGYALSASFSRDGSLLAAGGSGREIRLWDVSDPAHITAVGSPLVGPANDIGMVAFDPSAPRLAAAAYGGIVWIWDVSDPAHPVLQAKLRAAEGVPYALAWSPDGATLSAGGSTQQVWTWTADARTAAQQICAAAGAPITRDEWALYVQGRAYAPPCPAPR